MLLVVVLLSLLSNNTGSSYNMIHVQYCQQYIIEAYPKQTK
jgi:hypothetical protein